MDVRLHLFAILVAILSLTSEVRSLTVDDYNAERARIIANEDKQRLGGSLHLSPQEQRVSDILVQAKRYEFESARLNGTIFPAALNFFKSKELIEKSKVFKIIKKMPKGGALHLHSSAITSLEWLIKNVTYRPNLYMCYGENGSPKFLFHDKLPKTPYCTFELVETLRKQSGNPDLFDQYLFSNASLVVDDPDTAFVTVNDVWEKFGKYFGFVNGLYRYMPVFKEYYLQAMREFLDDNVQYMEIRGSLSQLYELDGTTHTKEERLARYRDYTDEFIKDNPDFIGSKIIMNGHKYAADYGFEIVCSAVPTGL